MTDQEGQVRHQPVDAPTIDDAHLSAGIAQTIAQPLLVLDADLRVIVANAAYCELFKVAAADTRRRLIYELGNGQWDIPELRRLLGEILPQRSVVQDHRVEHEFPQIGKRVMSLNARRLPAVKGRPELILLVISDRTEAEWARSELAGLQEFQAKLIDSVREGLLVLDPDLKVVHANQPFYDTFQVSPAESEGRPIYELGNGQWDIPRLRELLENVLPDNRAFDDVEVEHEFATIGRRIMLLNGRRLDHLDLILLAIRDATEQHRLQAHQRTLMGELNHRVKNILASVSALASRTLRESPSLAEFGEAFQTRIDALARTQDLLMRAPERSILLTEVLRLELQAQGGAEGATFRLDGPDVTLTPEATQAFAMAIHELTTNAVKHGAFASPEGRVDVTWSAETGEGGETRVRFRWREHCPDVDTDPARRGYGSRVLEAVFSHSLNGNSDFTLHPDGAELVAEFEV